MIKRFVLLLLCLLLVSGTKANAHSGRTDSAGGHFDKSAGEYHFHQGYPAHQHYDGICPYDYESGTGKNDNTKSTEESAIIILCVCGSALLIGAIFFINKS